MEGLRRGLPPLAGVFHRGRGFDDALVADMNRERYENVLAAKMFGAWHLHRLTRGQDLDYFVMFSSVVGALGNPGQASYAAANAFLDSLAELDAHGDWLLSPSTGELFPARECSHGMKTWPATSPVRVRESRSAPPLGFWKGF